MNVDFENTCWPYLSPTRADWHGISGPRVEVRRLLTRLSPDRQPAAAPVDTVLDMLASVARADDALRTETLLLVAEAHLRGATWAAISRHTNGSRQSVHQRYQRHIHSRRLQEILSADLRQVATPLLADRGERAHRSGQ